jgi:hypothetical protein
MPSRTSALAPVVALLCAALVLGACGSGSAAAPAPTQAAATQAGGDGEPTPGTSLSSCELVAPSDIEAALKLAAGTVTAGTLEQQPTSLDAAANECRYTGDWGALIVSATPTDGLNVYDALVKAFEGKYEAVEVADGGLWFENNDRGYFLKGPRDGAVAVPAHRRRDPIPGPDDRDRHGSARQGLTRAGPPRASRARSRMGRKTAAPPLR